MLLDLAAEAELVRVVAGAAPALSLVHDVDEGGLEAALAEAAEWSGVPADADASTEGARFVLACAPDAVPAFAEPVGTVG